MTNNKSILAQKVISTIPQVRNWAYSAFDDAQKLAELLKDDRAKSYAVDHMAELYTAKRRYREAEQLFSQALFFASHLDAPELRARWRWLLGRMFKAQNQLKLAQTFYRQALDDLNSIKYALVLSQRVSPSSFRENAGAVYLELADLMLNEADQLGQSVQK